MKMQIVVLDRYAELVLTAETTFEKWQIQRIQEELPLMTPKIRVSETRFVETPPREAQIVLVCEPKPPEPQGSIPLFPMASGGIPS